MTRLVLIPVTEGLRGLTTAVLYEKEAGRYLRLDIVKFRALVSEGAIPCRIHAGGKRRIYLRSDLDAYLQSLQPCNMPSAKIQAATTRKGGLE